MLRQKEGQILCECVSFSRGLVETLKRNMEVTFLVAWQTIFNLMYDRQTARTDFLPQL